MTISPSLSSISVLPADGKPTDEQMAFFGYRFRSEQHQLVLSLFRKSGIAQKELARRMGRDPAQVTKWLAGSANWTSETFGQILLALGYVPSVAATPFDTAVKRCDPAPASGQAPTNVVRLAGNVPVSSMTPPVSIKRTARKARKKA